MKVLIIEDEPLAAHRLKGLLSRANPSIEVLGVLDTVKASVKWLASHEPPQLIFMDIHLADGLGFEIFEKVEVTPPVIFTTAYDEYALKAFKVNSIDYILKPIDEADLRRSIEKFKTLSPPSDGQADLLGRLGAAVQMLTKKHKERFVTKVGEHLRFIDVTDILYFFSEEKATYCKTQDHRAHLLDFALDKLEHLIDPSRYYRVNRKYIVGIDAITDMISHTNSRLRIVLKGCDDDNIIVARERVQDFKAWLDR